MIWVQFFYSAFCSSLASDAEVSFGVTSGDLTESTTIPVTVQWPSLCDNTPPAPTTLHFLGSVYVCLDSGVCVIRDINCAIAIWRQQSVQADSANQSLETTKTITVKALLNGDSVCVTVPIAVVL